LKDRAIVSIIDGKDYWREINIETMKRNEEIEKKKKEEEEGVFWRYLSRARSVIP